MTGATIDPPVQTLQLPPGLTLLRRPSARSSALHQLVVGHLADHDGQTLWIDARGDASTYALADRTRAGQHLDGVRIARAFTAYQHHTLVRRVVKRTSAHTALVVVPCTAARYRDDDVPATLGRDLLASSLAMLDELAAVYEVPVVVTTPDNGTDHESLVAEYADQVITGRVTDMGIRYDGPDFETTVYWQDGGFQTTIPYWVELFGCVCEADRPAGVDPLRSPVEG